MNDLAKLVDERTGSICFVSVAERWKTPKSSCVKVLYCGQAYTFTRRLKSKKPAQCSDLPYMQLVE